MEDPRLSRMYWALLKQSLAKRRRALWHVAVMRSGMLTVLGLAILLAGLAFGWHEHRLGKFGQLKKELNRQPQREAGVQPGGKDVVRLERSMVVGGSAPEFVSATLLPGRGMNVLQITANIPQRGQIDLLSSPALDEVSRLMSGSGVDANGAESLAMGGAIELPWAGRMSGSLAPGGDELTAMWHGMRITLPTDAGSSSAVGPLSAVGGLLLKEATVSVNTNVMPDGGEAEATFHPGDFDGHWPSQTVVTTSVQLSGRAIEMKIVARNTGDAPEPMGIGWAPRFAIGSGRRGQMMLKLPQGMRAEVKDRQTGRLSGRLLPVAGTPYDFTGHQGARLDGLELDDNFTDLRPGLMDNGAVVELRDPADGYGLRITAMTPTIKVLRVYAPADGTFISIEPRFNVDDPFGRQWGTEEDTGMVILQPGQSTQWKIRLEIFSLDAGQANAL